MNLNKHALSTEWPVEDVNMINILKLKDHYVGINPLNTPLLAVPFQPCIRKYGSCQVPIETYT